MVPNAQKTGPKNGPYARRSLDRFDTNTEGKRDLRLPSSGPPPGVPKKSGCLGTAGTPGHGTQWGLPAIQIFQPTGEVLEQSSAPDSGRPCAAAVYRSRSAPLHTASVRESPVIAAAGGIHTWEEELPPDSPEYGGNGGCLCFCQGGMGK
jgi:hypothetical protein